MYSNRNQKKYLYRHRCNRYSNQKKKSKHHSNQQRQYQQLQHDVHRTFSLFRIITLLVGSLGGVAYYVANSDPDDPLCVLFLSGGIITPLVPTSVVFYQIASPSSIPRTATRTTTLNPPMGGTTTTTRRTPAGARVPPSARRSGGHDNDDRDRYRYATVVTGFFDRTLLQQRRQQHHLQLTSLSQSPSQSQQWSTSVRWMMTTSRGGAEASTPSPAISVANTARNTSKNFIMAQIRDGMTLSQAANRNITAAVEACRVWEAIFQRIHVVDEGAAAASASTNSSRSHSIPPEIRWLSQTLYAACLVRTGRDHEAIAIYDTLLLSTTEKNPNPNTRDLQQQQQQPQHNLQRRQWRMKKAQCFQRLLRYSEAANEYQRCIDMTDTDNNKDETSITQARRGAATCILRSTGNYTHATDMLRPSLPQSPSFNHSSSVLAGEDYSCLEYIATGNLDRAVHQLRSSVVRPSSSSTTSSGLLLYHWILATLQSEQQQSKPENNFRPAMSSSTNENKNKHTHNHNLFLELIRINTSPYDDPDLIVLDDKIQLHELLTSSGSSTAASSSMDYWPKGYILPNQLLVLEQDLDSNTTTLTTTITAGSSFSSNDDNISNKNPHDRSSVSLWIAKSRAGYGSHGNSILTTEELKKMILSTAANTTTATHSNKDTGSGAQSYLLQQMIHPLLLVNNGYKFSLRVYVVYFSTEEMYISTHGLVKLASVPVVGQHQQQQQHGNATDSTVKDDDSVLASMHMTNSGRESFMQQYNLDYLWKELNNYDRRSASPSSSSSEKLWHDICNVAADVLLVRFPKHQQQRNEGTEKHDDPNAVAGWKIRRQGLGIPKILGLDFVVSSSSSLSVSIVNEVDTDYKKSCTPPPVLQPWLVEINRFPGLEPRDGTTDRTIKYHIVYEAWMKALERRQQIQPFTKEDHTYLTAVFQSLLQSPLTSSLQRLFVQ